MTEIYVVPAILAVAALWHVASGWVKAQHAVAGHVAALKKLQEEFAALSARVDASSVAQSQRCAHVEQLAQGLKNRLTAAEAASQSKRGPWGHGRAVKIG